MPELRIPNVIPINDHVWLLDDNHAATCYVVAGAKQAAVIDTSLGMSNIRAVAEALTPLPDLHQYPWSRRPYGRKLGF